MPVEIYRAFQSEGIAINRNYVYSLLQRAKDRGQVKERRGRYFPTEDALVSNDAH